MGQTGFLGLVFGKRLHPGTIKGSVFRRTPYNNLERLKNCKLHLAYGYSRQAAFWEITVETITAGKSRIHASLTLQAGRSSSSGPGM